MRLAYVADCDPNIPMSYLQHRDSFIPGMGAYLFSEELRRTVMAAKQQRPAFGIHHLTVVPGPRRRAVEDEDERTTDE
jgi:hypothetical protein